MRRLFLAMGAATAILVAGCAKEQDTPLRLVAEGMGDGMKMTVDGLVSHWATGDAVSVNGSTATVVLSDGDAYLNDIAATDNYCIVFPAEVYSGHSGSTVTVSMPATYHYCYNYNYSTNTYTQVLDAPMAYYGTAEDGTAIMRHLTGAFNIRLIRPSGMRIERIAVSTTQNHVMSGEMQFDLSNMDAIGSSAISTGTNNTVEMLFDYHVLDNGNYSLPSAVQTVQIPIPALSGNVNFTIEVEGIMGGTKFTFYRTQTTGGHLGRGEMANVTVDMNVGQPGVTTSALFGTTVQDGTTYYTINNAYEFRLFAYAVTGYRSGSAVDEDWTWDPYSYGGVDYQQASYLVTSNFDMGGSVVTTVRGLQGQFDGGGHTIGHVVAGGDYWESGLFIASTPSAIRNVTFNGLRVNAASADEFRMPISALGRATLISGVHINDLEIWNTCYEPQIGGFTYVGAPTILNSSIAFKTGQVLRTDYYVRYTPPVIFGGICTVYSGSPTWQNVTVDFSNIELRKTYSGYAYDVKVGGLVGSTDSYNTSWTSNSISDENISNVTIRGNVTVTNTGNGSVYKAKAYVKGTTVIDALEGVDVSGLTIY